MPVIDMSTLKPVGEFGSRAWGEACAEGSIKILEAANLPSTTPGPLLKITPIHLPG